MKNLMRNATLLVLCMSLSAVVFAEDSDSTEKKKETLEDKIKGKTETKGMFSFYQDTATGSMQMLIKKDQLDQEFIYQSFSMGGPPSLFLNQNMIRNTWVFSISHRFDKVEFSRENTSFYYNPDKAISKAANADVSRAKFFSTKVVFEDSASILIEVDDLFIGGLMDPVKPNFVFSDPTIRIFNLGSLNTGKSGYKEIRAFPENTDVVVSLTYDNPAPRVSGSNHVTDARYVEVKMQHSFIKMPDNNYKPRFDDPRVGYFLDQMNDVSTYDYPNYRDHIHRWHLEKKDPTAALSEPVKPIVWWVENTTPVEYRDIILRAGEKWNIAFEQAGFKNAVVMKMMPDTASWDPADIRYNVIRWVASDLGFAIGPSFVNPRTGEILGADITIDFGMLLFSLTEQNLAEVGYQAHAYEQESNPMLGTHQMCTMAEGKKAQQGFAHAMLHAAGASDLELKKLTEQFMTELILHEMGHTMGLAHNMKASQMLNLEQAHDTSLTRKIGTTASIMDYTIVNVHSDAAKQGDYYSTVPGPYDIWAIEYGYTPFNKDEEAGLKAILAKSSDPRLDFGNDADILSVWSGVDPRVLTWDMSSDVVEYATDRFEGINARIGDLQAHFVEPDASYQKLYFMYYMMQRGRYSMASAVSRYVGGIEVNRNFPGQTEVQPYTPVDAAYQRSAMAFLSQYVFAPDAFDADAALYPYLQRQRRGWNFGRGSEDPKIQNLALGVQLNALSFIMNANTLNRINNSSLYGNTYHVEEVMSDLVNACFEADWKTEVNLFRQNLQQSMVSYLIIAATNKTRRYDNASQSAAYAQLVALRKQLKKRKGKDDQTKAHRARLIYKIDQVLNP